jgi:hypothetical protein
MKEEVRLEAVDVVTTAIEKFGLSKPPKYDVCFPIASSVSISAPFFSNILLNSLIIVFPFQLAAKQVKETMDKRYAANWCCIIGEAFGADIVCEKQTLLYMFYGGNLAVLLFKNPF